MDSLLLLDFILNIVYMFLVVFSLWLLGFLLSLLIWTFAQEQANIAKQDGFRKQTLYDNEVWLLKPPIDNETEPYKIDQQKLVTPYVLQFPSSDESHIETLQCFAVEYTTEEFIQEALQVDPLQLDSLRDHYIEIDGTHEESVEQDRLENVQLNSLTESDIDDDEIHQQVMSIDIPSDTSAQNGHRDDRAQALSEQLRIGTINIQQGPSITMEHTDQSEYINSSGADDNMSASSYEEDSRGVFDNHVAETEPQNVGRVRPTTQTNCLETNVAPRIQHEPQVHQNQNVTAEDNPLQPTDAGDTESTMSNSVPYDVASMSLMSMSTGTLSSNFSNMSSEDSEAFAYEWIRLKTFSDWPLTSIFSTRLARNGWVSLGKGDRARCYSCNVVHEGWRIGDDPDQYHSPNCRFKDGQPNNVPISRATHPTPTLGKVSLLSTQGDGSSGNNPDPVQGELQPGLNRPQQECIPKETYSLSQETEGISSVVNNGNQNRIINQQAHKKNPSEKNVDHPKYPSYSNPAVRISSYTDWPAAMTQTPWDMALAGFFYAGYGDSTRCFFCGGGLRNWEAGDDPWVEHARWFPECPFISQFRGQEFIDLVQKCETELKNQEEMERQQTNPPNDTDPPSLENYSNTDSRLNSNVDDQTSLDEHENRNSLPNPIFDKRTSPKQENTILRNQTLCLTCMEKNVSIAFLPCGHLACCEDCAPAMRKCPICREFVRGTVKTFLA